MTKHLSNEVFVVNSFGGNVGSVVSWLSNLGFKPSVESLNANVKDGPLIIPGVLNSSAALNFDRFEKEFSVLATWISSGPPIIGICGGMQILARSSQEKVLQEEIGSSRGLGIFDANVLSLSTFDSDINLPLIGWYPVDGLGNNHKFYFCHSYALSTSEESLVLGYQQVGIARVPAIVRNENVYGFQFHPEKSMDAGSELIRRILK